MAVSYTHLDVYKRQGNDNYNAVGDSGKFSVAKVDSIIDVAVSDIKVGEDAVIRVKLLSDATGSVTVTVNGKDYTETVVNGVALSLIHILFGLSSCFLGRNKRSCKYCQRKIN